MPEIRPVSYLFSNLQSAVLFLPYSGHGVPSDDSRAPGAASFSHFSLLLFPILRNSSQMCSLVLEANVGIGNLNPRSYRRSSRRCYREAIEKATEAATETGTGAVPVGASTDFPILEIASPIALAVSPKPTEWRWDTHCDILRERWASRFSTLCWPWYS